MNLITNNILSKKIARKFRWQRELCFKKSQTSKIKKQVLENDSDKTIYLFLAPIHPNLGDQAQTMCILRWIKQWFPTYKVIWIPYQLFDNETINTVAEKIKPDDMVFVHSGYLTTELYGYLTPIMEIAKRFTKNRVVVLPQTVNIIQESNRQVFAEALKDNENLLFLSRDEVSYKKAKEAFPCEVMLFPDFVTSLIGLQEFNYGYPRDGVLFVLRNDKEKLYTDEQIQILIAKFKNAGIPIKKIDTTIKISPFAWLTRREKIIKKYLKLFSKYKLVITDRYHGTIFSQIVSTPAIIIASNDHKLESGVRWFPKEDFDGRIHYVKSLEEAFEKGLDSLNNGVPEFNQSTYFIDNYWSKLADIVKQKPQTPNS